MAFWNKKSESGPSWAAFVRLEEMLLDVRKQQERDRDTSRISCKQLAHACDEMVARLASIESRSAKEIGTGVKEWLPVLARMQEVTLAAMGHADLSQQFGLIDRQNEAAKDEPEEAIQWVDASEDEDGVTYG